MGEMRLSAVLMLQFCCVSPAAPAAEAPEPKTQEKVPLGAVPGGEAPEGIRTEFQALDADGDGSLSLREYARAVFARQELLGADKDRDGKLSREEYASYVPSMLVAIPGQGASDRWEGLFERLDKDKSGDVTESEAGQAWNMLRRSDANADGKVTRDEQAKARENREKLMRARRAGEFVGLDKNGDGSLSFAELLGQSAYMRRLRGEKAGPPEPMRLKPAGRDGALRAMDKNGDGRRTLCPETR